MIFSYRAFWHQTNCVNLCIFQHFKFIFYKTLCLLTYVNHTRKTERKSAAKANVCSAHNFVICKFEELLRNLCETFKSPKPEPGFVPYD